MSTTLNTVKCTHCGAERSDDGRRPCPGCGKRQRKPASTVDEDRIEGQDLVVVASNPEELVTAQHHMIARLDEKIRVAQTEYDSAVHPNPFINAAEEKGMTAAAKSLLDQARERITEQGKRLGQVLQRRVVYLKKVRAALAAGYVMMPNFPGHVIAIRTARKRPAVKSLYEVSNRSDVEPAVADPALPPGEGKYVGPMPERDTSSAGEGKIDVIVTGWDDEIALPVEFLKPTVVQRTLKALELRIFDEIVLVRDGDSRDSFAGRHQPPRGRDPMVVGRIILRKPGANRWARPQRLSFLIAWFMDTALI